MKLLLIFIWLLGCGEDEDRYRRITGGHRKQTSATYPKPCQEYMGAENREQNQQLAREAENARRAALTEERERLGLLPVGLYRAVSGRRGPSSDDPFPEAVAIFLDEKSPESHSDSFYSQLHGYPGGLTVYQTKPGSKQYFIVDEVAGDGAGSLLSRIAIGASKNDRSMHSWQVSLDNQLIRPTFSPKYETVSTVAICGCGPNDYVDYESGGRGPEFSLDQARPHYPKGVFLLPSETEPKIHSDKINVEYPDRSIQIEYVPETGKKCESPVC